MLNEQLQKEMEQEAKAEVAKITDRIPAYKFGYEDGYYDAGQKYAAKWQEAQRRADRYEKALKEIYGHAGFVPNKHEMITIAREAITHKTGSDDTVNR